MQGHVASDGTRARTSMQDRVQKADVGRLYLPERRAQRPLTRQ
jgi:hypothetical protein